MIIRISEYVSQSLLLFISITLVSLLYVSIFQPYSNQYIQYGDIALNKRKYLEYSKVSIVYKGEDTIILYNYGSLEINIKSIYIPGYGKYNGTIEILDENNWIQSNIIPPKTFFRLINISTSNLTEIYIDFGDYSTVVKLD